MFYYQHQLNNQKCICDSNILLLQNIMLHSNFKKKNLISKNIIKIRKIIVKMLNYL